MSSKDYIQRINRVIDYIDSHLDEELNLDRLAAVALFSPYHFHRIFTAFMGEPLNVFIKRLRLEKAARMLAGTEKNITEIALDCGFSSSSVFARSFREHYDQSATDWRLSLLSKDCKADSKIEQMKGKNCEAEAGSKPYHLDHKIIDERRNRMKVEGRNVRVENVEDMTVAYVRYIGPYAGDEALFAGLYEKLFKWAGARDLLNFPDTKLMSVYHDDPNLTDETKLRTSVCLTVPPDTEVSGDVGKMLMPAGKYAMVEFEVDVDQYGDAWNWVCADWLPDSGYEAADGLSYELSKNDPKQHPEGKHVFDICIPVKPA